MIYSFFQQKTYKKITPGPEKVPTLQFLEFSKKNSKYNFQINFRNSHQISQDLELLKRYKVKFTRGRCFTKINE